MDKETEEALNRAMAARDKIRHGLRLMGIGRAEADDVIQEASIVWLRAADKHDPRTANFSYFSRTCRNMGYEQLRANKNVPIDDVSFVDGAALAFDNSDPASNSGHDVGAGIRRIPEGRLYLNPDNTNAADGPMLTFEAEQVAAGTRSQTRLRLAEAKEKIDPVDFRIFKLKSEGKDAPEIADILNAEGVTTKRGKPWTKENVRKTLSREKLED